MSATQVCLNIVSTAGLDTFSPAAQSALAPQLSLHDQQAFHRQSLEQFIHARYAETYSADIAHFLPLLMASWSGGDVQGVLGLRPGQCGRFFVENYLTAPMEALVSERAGESVSRATLIETGNLAGTRGSSQLLFIVLTDVLYRAGFRWVTFTATAQVSALLHRLGFAPQEICEADPICLGEHAQSWGSYYANRPWVVIGDVAQAYTTLQRNEFALKLLGEHADEIDAIVAQLQPFSKERSLG
jgi:hypothetical protein